MDAPKRCIICHGRAVFGVAVPSDEEEEGVVWMADVCGGCVEFQEEIAARVREQSSRMRV
jgi:hypothetical protein